MNTPPNADPTRRLTQLLERVRSLDAVAEALAESPLPVDRLRLEHHLVDDLRLDSIQLLSLAVAVENEFDVAFSEEDDQEITTLKELLERVDARLEER